MGVNENNFIKKLRKKDEKALEYVIDNYGWLLKKSISKHHFTWNYIK